MTDAGHAASPASPNLTLAAGANTSSIVNVETVTGTASADTLTLEAAVLSTTIDLLGNTGDNHAVDGIFRRH